ncbi:hypothetical protein EHS13_16865 [Paenibacillus psychroresistens]|uniref:Uncharacterized protein n=1 Tax=Paenibacillus psychroresistens TaxID=1778678 RepID=A0A6B8RLN3_9BACL|nr:hypothetical protein [Paenibacillus psychroresistens]QGQ96435.1 hypothetical protein EHS13_16865 [Paenibacillus psychroresistens]
MKVVMPATIKSSFLGKLLAYALCFLIIISLGINAYQYKMLISERKNDINMSEDFMSNHAATFSNVFYNPENIAIMEYINNPDKLSVIIEGVQLAESYYMAASKFQAIALSGKSIMQSGVLLNDYLNELRSYRTYLESNSKEPYGNIKQVAIVIKDLQTISNWLMEKYKNKELKVYTDENFYKEVYPKLESDVKSYRFTFSSED